ncbi:MAG: alpha/beta fold hydrolase [Verrucomicrobiae bacterium]|nr:alpha/beta fold hydrolase [Verrucomicrobiae bacterium]
MTRTALWLFLILLGLGVGRLEAARPANPPAPKDVTLETADNVELGATYYPPWIEPDDVAPAVILLHEAGRTRHIWEPFARLLQRNGIAALTLDLRGHGDSVRQVTAEGLQRLDVAKFGPREYQQMLLDLEAAWDFLSTQLEVDTLRIAVMGSVLGANLAIQYAVVNDEVAALVLLSPAIENQGLRADEALQKLGKIPLRIVVAAGDAEMFEAAKTLLALRRSDPAGSGDYKELIAATGTVRGTDLLRRVESLPARLIAWLRQQFALPDVSE